MRQLRAAAVAASLAVGFTLSASADSARDLFQRMGEAVESLNYRGTLVHVLDNRPETLEVLHKKDGDQIFERLTSLSGSGREVVRRGEEVRCIFQERKQILVDWREDQSPLRAMLPQYNEELERYYSFEMSDARRRIADRDTHYVAVKPRDAYRYGYRLWIDKETDMPLACELVNARGDVIEAILFTEIEYDAPMSAADFEPRLPTPDFDEVSSPPAVEAAAPSSTRKPKWNVEDLPAGFSLTVVSQHRSGSDAVEHLVFTDGLASISVFAERHRQGREVISGAATIGVSSAFGRRLEDFQITVVGEVPPATVERVGNSIRPAR